MLEIRPAPGMRRDADIHDLDQAPLARVHHADLVARIRRH
jgi:hypothetical protein